MPSPVTHVIIGGVTLDLDDIEYQVTVSHGRNDIKSQPEASTAQVILRGSQGLDIALTDTVDITAWGTARFTGEVTDLAITHLSADPPVAVTTITCIGNLSNLGDRLTGGSGYSEQTVFERAEEILTDSLETYLNGGTDTLTLSSIGSGTATAQSCLAGLQQLAEWSGGTYFDTPNGTIVFESYGQRGLTTFEGIWSSLINPWTFYEQTWDSFPSSMAAVSLPANGVIFTPTWSQNQVSIINDITVSYGSNSGAVTATDATSIAAYGQRAYVLETGLKTSGDATTRADEILLAQAQPLWNLGQISVYVDLLDEPTRNLVLALVSGASVLVNGLPSPAPYTQFLGIVEGWAETYTPGQHILTLSISDPRYSYQTVTWAGVDAALTWAGVNPEIEWYNVVRSDDLQAA